jgi:peptidoglycan/LPS O-acetylase OafA/YrhL/cyclophilin family peptidyl-prolyl cis-trans isomerase
VEPVRYRPDIDGLRAVAVLAVIIFHASPRALPSGFIGVDIFFVISGFLISGILYRDAASEGISLLDFYVRRIRRIVPALTVVLIGVVIFGWLALTNLDYRELQTHIAAGSAFVSNFVLWGEAGYFDAPARFKPLLHLWSLGIEEQFYLFWPPIVMICARFPRLRSGPGPVGVVAAVIVCFSFGINLAVARTSPVTAFYMPYTRMWELLFGALLALPRPAMTGVKAEVLSWSGVGVLVAALVLIKDGGTYPGIMALLPTAAAALLIAAGPAPVFNRYLLANQAMVAIGLISYPLYLWHWPVLSFLQIAEAGAPTNQQKLIAVAVSFVLAAATFLLIERPIRRSMSIKTPLRIAAVAASLVVVGGVTFYALETDLITSRTPNLIAGFYSRVEEPIPDSACQAQFPTKGEYCHTYTTGLRVTTALIGDSHAAHFLDGVGKYLSSRGENVVHLGHSGCPPLIDLQRIADNRLGEVGTGGVVDTCRDADNSVIEFLAGSSSITRVIISFNGARPLGGGDKQTTLLAGTLLPPDESMRTALQRTAERLIRAGKQVTLLLQVPELEFHPALCVRRPFSFSGTVKTPCAVPRSEAEARQSLYRQVVADVKQRIPGLQVFDPWSILCDGEWCRAMIGNDLLYSDDNHLSREGSLFFADKFAFGESNVPNVPGVPSVPSVLSGPKVLGASERAPEVYRVRVENTRDTFVIEVHRDWAPLGADRFYTLVKSGFYDGVKFHRVLPYFMVQFGINGDPKIQAAWTSATIADDPVKVSNKRGTVAFATAGKDTRTTQVFINYRDNVMLDAQGFAPFGVVVEGMGPVGELESKYGDRPVARRIEQEGNAYLTREFPGLSSITRATIESASQ